MICLVSMFKFLRRKEEETMSHNYSPRKCAKYFIKNHRDTIVTLLRELGTMEHIPSNISQLLHSLYQSMVSDMEEYMLNLDVYTCIRMKEYEEIIPLLYTMYMHEIHPILKQKYQTNIDIQIRLDPDSLQQLQRAQPEYIQYDEIDHRMIQQIKKALSEIMTDFSNAFPITIHVTFIKN
jgi:hypothetical protein